MLGQLIISVRVRLAALFARSRLRSRAGEEIQFHLAMLEQRNLDRGLDPAELARRPCVRSEIPCS